MLHCRVLDFYSGLPLCLRLVNKETIGQFNYLIRGSNTTLIRLTLSLTLLRLSS